MIRSPLPAWLVLCAGLGLFVAPPLRPQDGGAAKIQQEISTGNLAGAVRDCDTILKTRPSDYRIRTLKGIALKLQGQTAPALKALRKALAARPDFVPALEAAARIEYQAGDPECRRTLERLLAARPGLSAAHAMLAALAYERKDCRENVAHAAKALAETRANPLARAQYAACLFHLNELEAAEKEFSAQLAERENDETRFNLGLVRYESKRYADAVETLRPLSTRPAPDSAVLGLMAAALEAGGHTPGAIETLRRATELYPRQERHYVDLAAICMERNAFEVGVEVLEVGAKNIPASAKIQVMAGVLYARAGRMEEAEAAFKRAEALDPDKPYGRVGLAAALLQVNAVEEAISLMREQHRKNPADARVSSLLAQAILQKANGPGELEEARSLLVPAVKASPGDARAHALLGKVYFLRKEFDKAVPELDAAFRLDPKDRTAAYQLMTSYLRLGRTEQTPELRRKVRELLEAERNQESEGGRYRLVIRQEAGSK